jgi:hypothetical protein
MEKKEAEKEETSTSRSELRCQVRFVMYDSSYNTQIVIVLKAF